MAAIGTLLLIALAHPGSGNADSHNTGCSMQEADVAITTAKAPSKASYGVGETLNLLITATNNGPCPAPQAEITLVIPGGLTPGSATGPGTYSPPVWEVDLAKEGTDTTKTLTLPVTTGVAGAHSLEAALTGGHFTDNIAGNDESTEVVNVVAGETTTTTSPPTGSSTTGTTTTTTPATTTTTTPGAITTTTGSTTTAPGTTTTTTTENVPVEGKKINAEETTGEVIVKLPGQDPRAIDPEGELLPPGTKIDATNGTVALTAEYNGEFEKGIFWGGALKLGQKESTNPVTVAKLVGGFNTKAASVAKKGKKGGKRRLWGQANKGHFRTQGRSGSATVRGTKWKTTDKAKGTTKFVLKHGKLFINDFSKRGKVDKVLKGKGKYVADPNGSKAKKKRR